ncbi:hypothetical protein ASE63_05845 [Bosea sp. Root381]|nr:hypothetical protein ASE63_05845 [Bosea sp. Root381]
MEGAVRRHAESVGFAAMLTLWRHKRMIVALVVLAAAAAVAFLLTAERRYTSAALVQVDFSRDDQGGGASRQQPLASLDVGALIETEARLVRSRAIVRQVAQRLASEHPKSADGRAGTASEPDERSILALMRDVTVRNDSRSYLIEIGFTANDPQRAARIANLFVEVYLKNRSEASFTASRRASEWYAAQINETRTALETAETAASEYRSTHNIVDTSSEGGVLLQQQMREVSSQIIAAGLARLNEEARLERATRAAAQGLVPPDVAALPQIQRLAESREVARRQAAELSASVGERHPQAERARLLVEETEQRLRDEVAKAVAAIAVDVSNARRVEGELDAAVRKARLALIEAKAREAELRTLQGKAESLRNRLRTLTENQVQAQALADLKPVAAQVMVPAEPIMTPSGPKKSLVLGFAIIAAAALGAGIAFLLERRDTGFRTEDEVLREIDCPCVGLVPASSGTFDSFDIVARREAMRAIAASTGLTSSQAGAKTVLVTSALPGEGKSMLVDSLALSLMEMGRSVLIIDASPCRELDCEVRPALEDMVVDPVTRHRFLEKGAGEPIPVLQRRNADLSNSLPMTKGEWIAPLSVIQRRTGLSEGGAIFARAAFGDFVREACGTYDVVIIEAPPVTLVADALILAPFADIVLQAVRWNATPKALVAETLKRLRDASVRVQGIVLTGVDFDKYQSYQGFFRALPAKKSRQYYATFD